MQAATAAAERDGDLITRWEWDAPSGVGIVHRIQDVEPILEINKQLYTADDGYSPTREFRRVASIPKVVVEKWMREEGINIFDKNHREAFRRKLNDPENLFLRTAPGRV